ncbi:dual specificity protein kinase yak1 [Puccinia graminis f. sp. tritici]|uniref:Dual specificity protein kinase yak1 n=1 Tax=Puccinia graminis f. sp. tritici TaxID=56615 RepID=A0A5B0LI52_PUCGR|nr:dual specificity protein kinase yak1 [Puccinia graminis f. sp. tritici]
MNLPANNINNSNQQQQQQQQQQHQYYTNNTNYHQNLNQSSSHSSSQAPSTEQYYGSRSASRTSSHPQHPSATQTDQIGFRRLIPGSAHLFPILHDTPVERRVNPYDGTFISPLSALTIHLADTYRLVNPAFRYELSLNPRRVLTKPSKPAGNNGLDNEDSDYILYVNDILGGSPSSTTTDPNQLQLLQQQQHQQQQQDPNHQIRSIRSSASHKYLILDVLGQGTFGQVVKCQDMKTHQVVAVKVVKNKQAYFSQSMMEVTILELLNNTWDPENKHHILRMKDTFIHHNHLCLVFELLSSNLYELIKQNSFRGLSTSLVRVFTNQLLDALTVLNEAHLIHCDLKPENILLTSLSSPEIKVIDFGSACHERQTVYTYIQSRFYRSPEVILGLPYSSAIDMWSLGCICVELFLGLPLFPGTSEYNQITRIVEMLGMPPSYMLDVGRQTTQFFDVIEDTFNGARKVYKLKSLEQYSKEHNVAEQPSKRYFQQNTLEDIISQYPVIRKGMKPADLEKGLLNINPIERWSPQQARLHPFILGEPLREPYIPMKSGFVSNPGGDRVMELAQKGYGHSPIDPQASPQTAGGAGSNDLSKRPYGGLPAAPVRSGQKVYDAAAYSQLQAQQQVINAQAAAMRQHQVQAAQQSQNPYALPQDNRSNLTQLPPQSNHQQQPPNSAPALTHQLPPQYASNRVALSHPPQPTSLATSSSAAINIPHSYYSTRGAGGSGFSGPLTTGSIAGPQMQPLMSHNQMIYNPILNPSGSTNPSSHVRTSSGSRQRSGTLDQMDIVPPQLQKVQVDLANYSGQSVTPVLRRDDQYLAWEQRQQHGIGAANSTGIPGNSGLTRRASYRANPQLDYLHEQAESNDAWSSSHRGQGRYHYQPNVNASTHYMSTGSVPVPGAGGMMIPQQAQGHPHPVGQPPSKPNSSSFSVVVDDDYPGMRPESHSRPSGSARPPSTRSSPSTTTIIAMAARPWPICPSSPNPLQLPPVAITALEYLTPSLVVPLPLGSMNTAITILSISPPWVD